MEDSWGRVEYSWRGQLGSGGGQLVSSRGQLGSSRGQLERTAEPKRDEGGSEYRKLSERSLRARRDWTGN